MEKRISGICVKKLRERNLMTQEQFAEACGLNTRTVQRIESSGTASSRSVKAIVRTFGIDALELEDGELSFKQEARAFTRRAFGIALLWMALAALVYVPTSDGGGTAAVVAILGFVSFALAYSFLRPSTRT